MRTELLLLLPLLPPGTEDGAIARLTAAEARLATARTVRASYTRTDVYGAPYKDLRQRGDVVLARPGSSRVFIKRERRIDAREPWRLTGNNTLSVTDGQVRSAAFFHPFSVQARREAAPSTPELEDNPLLEAFYRGARMPSDRTVGLGDVTYTDAGRLVRVHVGDRGWVDRVVRTDPRKGVTTTWTLDRIVFDSRVSPAEFVYRAPSDALPYEPGGRKVGVEVGDIAPDFALPAVGGGTAQLSEWRGEVVVLEFFATWCWSCNQALPYTDKLVGSLGVKGVGVAIRGSRKDLDAWAKRRRRDTGRLTLAFENAKAPTVSGAYGVFSTPTTLVIGRSGRVEARIEGFDGPDPRLLKAIRAAQARS